MHINHLLVWLELEIPCLACGLHLRNDFVAHDEIRVMITAWNTRKLRYTWNWSMHFECIFLYGWTLIVFDRQNKFLNEKAAGEMRRLDVLVKPPISLQWRHIDHDDVWNHQPCDCLLNRLFMRRSKKTSKLRITSLCEGNSPVTVEFPAQRASNAENVSIWWRHHDAIKHTCNDRRNVWFLLNAK